MSSVFSRTSQNRDQACATTKEKTTHGGLPSRDTLKAAAVLAVVILLVYGQVCFLGYTLSPAVRNLGVMNGFQYGYGGREPYTLYVMDPLATGGQNWPIYAIISQH